MAAWEPLGAVAPRDLVDARLKLHRAVQWLARIARSYLPAKDDDSHTALIWSDEPATSLATAEDAASPHFRLSEPFRVVTPVVAEHLTAAYAPRAHKIWFGAPDRPNNVLILEGRSDGEINDLLPKALQSLGADGSAFSMEVPYGDELPAVDDNSAPRDDHAAELCRYFSNANALLQRIAARERSAGPVRIWPHHFDIAALIELDTDGGEDARSINIGLSPGDVSYAQPYFYVTPWPEPETLPPAPDGLRWHTSGFAALVATAEELMLGEGAETRTARALNEAVMLCRSILEDAKS